MQLLFQIHYFTGSTKQYLNNIYKYFQINLEKIACVTREWSVGN